MGKELNEDRIGVNHSRVLDDDYVQEVLVDIEFQVRDEEPSLEFEVPVRIEGTRMKTSVLE